MKTDKEKEVYKFIAGIGASAGGLEALQRFLTVLPDDTGIPFIVVQHLSHEYKSQLCGILGKYTSMPVLFADEGVEVSPNTVYVNKPGKLLTLKNGVFHTEDQDKSEINLPIDIFFRSLAEEAGQKAIALILSGTGTDGSDGIRMIKENDGLVFIQEISTAKFDGMPRAAMKTGIPDIQLSPENLAAELLHIVKSGQPVSPATLTKESDKEQMKKCFLVLKKISNVNFTNYKQAMVLRKLSHRMLLTHKETLTDYVDLLYDSEEEARHLSRELLVSVTSFFHDADLFARLKERVIPGILSKTEPKKAVRIWVAGCSTGEEAYSIAILFKEVMEELSFEREVIIFATDLDLEAISFAGKGVYRENSIALVSKERRSKFFTIKNNYYEVNRDIRKMIVFSPHNVFQDPPFGRLDFISCRNMLTYFQPVLQESLFAIFHYALRDNGYLFLGRSESVGIFSDAFPVFDQTAKIYGHHVLARLPGGPERSYLKNFFPEDPVGTDRDRMGSSMRLETTEVDGQSIDTKLLEKYLPGSLVVNEHNMLLHTYGAFSNYVHLPVGRYSNDLFDLLTEEAKTPVMELLREARDRQKEVFRKGLFFHGERQDALVDLSVLPVSRGGKRELGRYAIVFSEPEQKPALSEETQKICEEASAIRIEKLKKELTELRNRLAESMAEKESASERFFSECEELLTANEEMKTSNEELQSENKELREINNQYKQKLTELSEVNDDIANFLSASLTGVLFADEKLIVKKFNEYAEEAFTKTKLSIGIPLGKLSMSMVNLEESGAEVLKTLIPIEREVKSEDGKPYFLRIAPYRSLQNRIKGCVFTLTAIKKRKAEIPFFDDAETEQLQT